jgi:hypothetical protein
MAAFDVAVEVCQGDWVVVPTLTPEQAVGEADPL